MEAELVVSVEIVVEEGWLRDRWRGDARGW